MPRKSTNCITMKDKKLIILDRDGVINVDSSKYIKSATEWKPIPGSIEAIISLHRAGFKLAIATNQSGLARGYFDLSELNVMHAKMNTLLKRHMPPITNINFCPHLPEDKCNCRKPKPELLINAMKYAKLNPEDTIMVGDSLKDMLAAKHAKCSRALVKTGNGEDTSNKIDPTENIPIFNNLKDFADHITKK